MRLSRAKLFMKQIEVSDRFPGIPVNYDIRLAINGDVVAHFKNAEDSTPLVSYPVEMFIASKPETNSAYARKANKDNDETYNCGPSLLYNDCASLLQSSDSSTGSERGNDSQGKGRTREGK